MKIGSIIVDSFFDGFGPGALFVRTRRPGAPTQVFDDSEVDAIFNKLGTLVETAEPEDLFEMDARLERFRESLKQKLALSQSAIAVASHSSAKG